MKKLLFLFAAICAVIFTGCEKNDKESLDSRLVGTKWQTRDHAYEVIWGGLAYNVYEFVSTTQVEKYITRNGNIVRVDGTYSYKLDYPILTIDESDEEEESILVFEFKNSRTFVRQGANENGWYMKYIRQ